jgi:hypothetical protein
MNCSLLKEVIFSADSSIREFCTFQNCQSLCRMIIPGSMMNWAIGLLCEGTSNRELMVLSSTPIRTVSRQRALRAFVTYANDHDVNHHRRLIHLTQR